MKYLIIISVNLAQFSTFFTTQFSNSKQSAASAILNASYPAFHGIFERASEDRKRFFFFRPTRQILKKKLYMITNRTPNVLVENLNGMRQVLYSRKRFIPCATAGSRTRVNGLGSRHDNRYTTVAHAPINFKVWLFISLLSYSYIISYFWPSSGLDFTH